MKNKEIQQDSAIKQDWTSLKRKISGLLVKCHYDQFFWLILSFVYAGGMFLPGKYPFGVAIVAAYCFSEYNLTISLGAFVGYLYFFGAEGLAYCGAVVVCAACGVMLTGDRAKSQFLPWISLIAMTFTVGAIGINSGLRNLVLIVCEILVCGVFTYLYIGYRENKSDELRLVGRLAMLLTAVLTMSQISILGVLSPTRAIVIFLVLVYVYYDRSATAGIVAVLVGALMDINSGGSPYFSGAYGIAAIVMVLLKPKSRFKIAAINTFIASLIVLWSPENAMAMPLMWECFFASVLFTALPECTIQTMGALVCPIKAVPEERPKKEGYFIKTRLEALSSAISNVSDTLLSHFDNGENKGDMGKVFDRAAENVCRKCPIAGNCWDKDYVTTYGALNDVSQALRKNGYVRAEDFPHFFACRCLNIKGFIGQINEEYSLWQRRCLRQNGETTQRKVMARQYMGINRAIESFAENMDRGPEYYPDFEDKTRRILVHYDKNAKATVYSVNGRMSIEIFGASKNIQVDMPQICDSLSLCLGRELLAPEEILSKEGAVLRIRERERYTLKINVGIREKKGEQICGDYHTYFTTDDGRAVVMLSDGMGSGQAANVASKNTISLISRFVKAGCSLEESVSAVLPAIAANVERVGFATLDLLEVNLFTGSARLLKYGSPPTYVKRHKKVQKYTANSFPPGLDQENTEDNKAVYFKLSEDNVVILGTDGVFDSENLAETEELIKSIEGDYPGFINGVIDNAYRMKNRIEDDMTMVVVKLEKNMAEQQAA